MESSLSFLDMHTILFTMVVTNLVCTLVMLLLWQQNHKRLDGITYWVANFTLQTVAIVLIVLRGMIPDWLSIDFANILSMVGIYLGLRGLESFFKLKSNQVHNYILLILYSFVLSWFDSIYHELAIRNMIIGSFSLIFFIQCVWLLFFRVKRTMLNKTVLVGVVFIAYCAVDTLRIFDYFLNGHSAVDYFAAGPFEAFVILSYKMLLIILTFGLALMFNKNLLDDIAVQEEKFKKAFHTSPYAIVLTRMADGHIMEINETFHQYTGYSAEEIIGNTTSMLDLWENIEDRHFVLDELSKDHVVRDREFYFRKKNGERIIGLFSAEFLTINGEKCMLSVINDISKRKKAEVELTESEAKFRSLFTRMSEGFALHEVVYDAHHNPVNYIILDLNPAYENQVGIQIENVKGKLATEAYGVPTAPYLDVYSRVAETGEPQSFQTFFQPLNRYFEIQAFSPYKGFFATVFSDVTEKRQAEEALMQSEARFRELNATKDKFFSIIAHDLKSPFNSILGFSKLLEESVQAKDCQTTEEYASIIRKSTQHTMDLLMNLLEWSRSQTGRMEFTPEYLEIKPLLKEVLGLFDQTAKQKSIVVKMEEFPNTTVFADKVLLSAILRNLISNAIKFTHPNGQIELSSSQVGLELQVCVRDNGVGIKQEDLSKVFHIEESISKPGTLNEQGTGLGLLLCNEFVQKHGGKIWVESTHGKGSAFYFTLPLFA
jgi:PAS domain S-box-containing protein